MDTAIMDKIEEFFGQYRLRHYAKGQILILNGDDTNYVYHLVKGRVKEYDVTYRGDEIILNVFKPPAFFPMSLAINKTPNPYIYEAETNIDIRQAPAEEAVTFIKDNPDVMFDLLSRLYRGTDGLLARMAHLMTSSAKARLMFEILLACRRYGEGKDDGSCTITLNEGDLAARAGLSRETVSREMGKLHSEELLELTGGTITIHNISIFEERLGKVV
jgi:CRP-like cAMP-binding protein